MGFKKGCISYNKGKKLGPHTEEHKRNISKALTGRKLSEEHKRNISLVCIGRPSPRKGKHHTEEAKLKQSERAIESYKNGRVAPNKGKKFSTEWIENLSLIKRKFFENGGSIWNKGLTKFTDDRLRKSGLKISKINTGKNHHRHGIPLKPHWGKYKNINMRSSWEIAYAKYLDKNNIKWEYEPDTFDLGDTTYTPDFKVGNKKYVEIKGYMSPEAYFKIKKFILTNSEIDYVLLIEKDLKQKEII